MLNLHVSIEMSVARVGPKPDQFLGRENGLRSVSGAQFLHQARHVMLDGLLADRQLGGDLPVRLPAQQELHDLVDVPLIFGSALW
jgi:hypothetical protein